MNYAEFIVSELTKRGENIGVAESITGGHLSGALIDIAGASNIFAGGIVAYSNQLKITDLNLAPELFDQFGAASAEVAQAMASGAKSKFAATWGLSTTGVAGPGPHNGRPAGTVWIGIAGPGVLTAINPVISSKFLSEMSRNQVRSESVAGALMAFARILNPTKI
jgi:nicotinamide-nucleotide amidase